MERQDAIKKLLKAGKREQVVETIDRHVTQAARAYQEIRNDPTRNEDYKRWSLAVSANRVNRSLTEELVREAGRVVVTDRDDVDRVFGTHGLAGDSASLVISRRDAGDRVAGITSPDELRALLARATRTGDEVLARASAERAMEIRDTKTLHQFLEDRPHLDDAVQRLWNSEQASDNTMGIAFQLSGLRPSELGDLSFGSIENLADSGEPTQAPSTASQWSGSGIF